MTSVALALLRVSRSLGGNLLLLILRSLITPAYSAGQSAHRGARGSAGACIAGYGTLDRSQRCATRRSSDDWSLRGRRLVSYGVRIRGSGLRPARIESGLPDRP
jgi:hypothetical protein